MGGDHYFRVLGLAPLLQANLHYWRSGIQPSCIMVFHAAQNDVIEYSNCLIHSRAPEFPKARTISPSPYRTQAATPADGAALCRMVQDCAAHANDRSGSRADLPITTCWSVFPRAEVYSPAVR